MANKNCKRNSLLLSGGKFRNNKKPLKLYGHWAVMLILVTLPMQNEWCTYQSIKILWIRNTSQKYFKIIYVYLNRSKKNVKH